MATATKFVGTWVFDPSAGFENLDTLMTALGVDKESQEKYKFATGKQVFTDNGDGTFSIVSTNSALPGKERRLTFTPGVAYDNIGIDDSSIKATITMPDDSTMIEKGTHSHHGEVEYKRVVNGDQMKCTSNMKGVTTSYHLKRA